jgi:hypothetical protein
MHICECCGAEIKQYLRVLYRAVREVQNQNEEILSAVVTDPAKLAELTEKLKAQKAAIDAAIQANPVPAS